MDYKKSDTIEKAMKEVKKGVTVCSYKSGKLTKEYATNEIGSAAYPCEESILNRPKLLEHPY